MTTTPDSVTYEQSIDGVVGPTEAAPWLSTYRPHTPWPGLFGFATDTDLFEFWDGSAWLHPVWADIPQTLTSPVSIGTATATGTQFLRYLNDGTLDRGTQWYHGANLRAASLLSLVGLNQVWRDRMFNTSGASGFTMMDRRYNAGTLADPHVINVGPDATASQYINLDVRGDVKFRTANSSPSALGALSGATNPPNTLTVKTTYSGASRSSLIRTVSLGSNSDSLALYAPDSLDYVEVVGQLADGFNGSRVGIRSSIFTNVPTTLSNDSRAFTSFSGGVQIHDNLGGVATGFGTRHYGYGTGFAMFAKSVLNTGATNIQGNVGFELDVTTEAGASVLNQIGMQLVHEATNAVAPLRQNVAFMIGDQGGASVNAAWELLFGAGEYAAQWAGNPDSTILGARSGYNYGSVPSNVAFGVDMLEINTTGTGRTGGGAAYRWQGGQIIPGTNGGTAQVGYAALSGTATGVSLDLTYSKTATIAVNTPGTGYTAGDLFGIPTAGAIGRVTSVSTKTITGATAANPVVITSVGHGLANGTEIEITGVVGMTQLTSRAVTGITNASPGVITCANHGLQNGAQFRLASVGGMTQINGNPYYLAANVTANTLTATHLNGTPVDTTTFSAYTSGGTIILPYLIKNVAADTFELTDLAGGNINGTGYTAYVSGGTATTGIPTAVSIHRHGWQVSGPTTNIATANLTRGLMYGTGLTVDLTWTPQTELVVQPSGGITRFATEADPRDIQAAAEPTLSIWNEANATGGGLTKGVVVDTKSYSTGAYEHWAFVSQAENNGATSTGRIVPGYFRAANFATGATADGQPRVMWGIVAEARDDSGDSSNTSQTILQGIEVNVEADGDDDLASYGRLGVVVIASRAGGAGTMTASYGVAVTAAANAQFKSGFRAAGAFTQAVFDSRSTAVDAAGHAVWLADGQDIQIGTTTGPTISAGAGVPAATEERGSIYLRTGGGVGTTLYVSQGAGVWNAVAGV